MERYLRLGEIFMMIREKAFAGLSVMPKQTCTNYLQ